MYGQPALGISLPWTAALRITPLAAAGAAGAAGAADAAGAAGAADAAEQPRSLEPLPPLPAPLAGMLADLPHAAVIEIRSQIPIGLGFGSSAALCVAAERALAGVGAAPADLAQPHDAPLASGAPRSPPADLAQPHDAPLASGAPRSPPADLAQPHDAPLASGAPRSPPADLAQPHDAPWTPGAPTPPAAARALQPVPASERLGAAPAPPPPPASVVWQGAHEREKVFHGRPSGADTGLAAHPGVGFLSWPKPAGTGGGLPRYESLSAAELHLVVAAVPRRGDTRTQVAAVAERMRAGDAATQRALRRLGDHSREARELMIQPQSSSALGAVADAAHRVLASLGLADPAQDRLLHAGRRAGACGGKLSGAGGGGACFLVCSDAATAARVLAAVQGQAAVASHLVVAGNATRQAHPQPPEPTLGRWLHHA